MGIPQALQPHIHRPIIRQPRRAIGAGRHVRVHLFALCAAQAAIVRQQQFDRGVIHARSSFRYTCRNRVRARCSRIRAAPSLRFSASATSEILKPWCA